MICRRCRAENPEPALYCSHCGQPLSRRPQRAKIGLGWPVVLAGAIVLGGAVFIGTRIFSPRAGEPRPVTEDRTEPARAEEKEGNEAPGFVVGEITVLGSSGASASKWKSVVAEGGWIALPTMALLGAEKLFFNHEDGRQTAIEGAAAGTVRDPVTVLRIDGGSAAGSIALAPWRRKLPLAWRACESDGQTVSVISPPGSPRGRFLGFPLTADVRKPGVFIQEGRVVGWTFGGWTDRGYLWAEGEGAVLEPSLAVGDLLRSLFGEGRESRFRWALALGDDTPPERRLEAFVSAFGVAPLLAPEDVPPELRPEAVLAIMRDLASLLIEDGREGDVLRILDDDFLAAASDVRIVEIAVLASAKIRGFSQAVDDLDRHERNITKVLGRRPAEMESIRARIYKDWIREMIRLGGDPRGLTVVDRAGRMFPDDVELHLLGVELAVAEKNWTAAAQLLGSRTYPGAWDSRVKILESAIGEGRRDEGTFTIRFDPTESFIPVEALLNGRVTQKFIIDTGATISSIPSNAAEALGIRVDSSTPIVAFGSASGVGYAYQVLLESVELEGEKVFNLSVLILDTPGTSGYGLLGTNFLDNFQIDLDKQKGTLRMKKK